MPVPGVISLESDGSLRFGDYVSKEKQKSGEFENNGDVYIVKSHSELTRVEKNGKLLYESVPGTLVRNFSLDERKCVFTAEGVHSTQITIELEPETEYRIFIDGANMGKSKSNLSSKLNISAELSGAAKEIRIERL